MDITSHQFPDASPADQLRYLKQQYARAFSQQSIRDRDGREVVRQPLSSLAAAIEKLERMTFDTGGVVHSAHARM